jgi:hypothetical protein
VAIEGNVEIDGIDEVVRCAIVFEAYRLSNGAHPGGLSTIAATGRDADVEFASARPTSPRR